MNLRSQTTSPKGWPPEEIAFEVRSIDLAVLPGQHPLYLARQAEVEANWAAEVAANPHLFNGQMVLQHHMTYADGVIAGEAYAIPYAMLLWWRKREDRSGAFHLFGFAAIVSSDGALIAIRMGGQTANAGQVYCAGGSLDLNDIVGDRLDLFSNMRREVSEETGLDLSDAVADPKIYAAHNARTVAVFQFHHFPWTADEILTRIARHMEHDEEKEIAAAVVIRSSDRTAQPYTRLMYPILDLFFEGRKFERG